MSDEDEATDVINAVECELKDLEHVEPMSSEGKIISFLAIYPSDNADDIEEMAYRRMGEIREKLRAYGYGASFKDVTEIRYPYFMGNAYYIERGEYGASDEFVLHLIAYPIGTDVRMIEKYDKEHKY